MSWQDASDEALVEAFKQAPADERRHLASVLFERHYTRVARWCFRYTGERESAADLAQTIFLNVYTHLDGFQGASRFTTWLYTITRHECLARVTRDRTRAADADEEALVDVPSPTDDPETAAARANLGDYARQVLTSALDDVERRVFTLHYGDELSLDQVTRLLGLTNASGAKAYIVSAKRKLARFVRRVEARGGRL